MFAGNTVNSLKATDVNEAAAQQGNVSGYYFDPADIAETVVTVPALPGDTVFVSREDTPFYPEIAERRELYFPKTEPTDELTDLKEQINASFEEVASLLGGLQDQIADLEGRIARYNGKSSHKI